MDVVSDVSAPLWPGQRSVITIGAYDGLHRGHRTVIADVRRRALAAGARSAVVTFDRHPASIVRPDSAPRLLTDLAQKLELLGDTGVDATVVVPFDAERAAESAEDFVLEVLVECLGVSEIVVGADFHFGRRRHGNIALLGEMGTHHDFSVTGLQLIGRDDAAEPVSSTAIRRALADGEVAVAAQLLGRPHEVRGFVAHGDERGRLLGFPTANVEVPTEICLPADGVYACWYERPDGQTHPCAVNLGRRPTFYERAESSLLEAHLIGFSGDLYGEAAKVRFVERLRPEQRFSGLDELTAQLRRDVDAARSLLGRS